MPKDLEIRCFCQRKPLLAVGGRDRESKKPFVHIKSVRGERVNVEAIVTEGTVRIRCRECFRWHTIRIVNEGIKSQAERLPESIAV